MKAWHVLWWAAALVALAAGALLAIIAVPPGAMIALGVVAAMALGIAARITDEQHGVRAPFSRYLRRAAPGLVIGPAVGGLIGTFGWAGTLLVGVLIGTSPFVVHLVAGRWWKPTSHDAPLERRVHRPALPASAAPKPTCPMEPWALPDEQLFHAWQLSYVLLQHATNTTERTALVTARQLYLDELERRNPDGFRLWMASGARAASDPRRYLSSS